MEQYLAFSAMDEEEEFCDCAVCQHYLSQSFETNQSWRKSLVFKSRKLHEEYDNRGIIVRSNWTEDDAWHALTGE